MSSTDIDQSIPVACIVDAIPSEDRSRWLEVSRQIYSSVEEILELEDGYALRLNSSTIPLLGEHLLRDRQCCPFVRWELVLEQANGPTWLRLRGPTGTAEFIRASIVETGLVPERVASAAGFAGATRPAVTTENVEQFAETVSRREKN